MKFLFTIIVGYFLIKSDLIFTTIIFLLLMVVYSIHDNQQKKNRNKEFKKTLKDIFSPKD